jgi:hypothetical protein
MNGPLHGLDFFVSQKPSCRLTTLQQKQKHKARSSKTTDLNLKYEFISQEEQQATS